MFNRNKGIDFGNAIEKIVTTHAATITAITRLLMRERVWCVGNVLLLWKLVSACACERAVGYVLALFHNCKICFKAASLAIPVSLGRFVHPRHRCTGDY